MSNNIQGNYYNKHESKNPFIRFLTNNFNKKLIFLIRPLQIKKILDVGCGEGYTSNYLKEKLNLPVLGIDIGEEVIDKAKKLHTNVSFQVGSIYDIKQKNNSFDLVVATEVLEHLEFPDKGIEEAKRVSSKYCIFSVPYEPIWRILNLLRLAYIKNLGNSPGHIQHWNKHKFKNLLKPHFDKVTVVNALIWNIALCEK